MAFLDRFLRHPAYPTLGAAAVTAWLWALLLGGRVLPWQATQRWVLVFAVAFALAALWWGRHFRQMSRSAASSGTLARAAALGTAPLLGLMALVLLLAYLSDSFNHLIARPYWLLPILVGAALLTLASESLQLAAAIWLANPNEGVRKAVAMAFSRRSGPLVLMTLSALGVLQATGGVAPIGDDIWHYSEVYDALLAGKPYPTVLVPDYYQEAGMGGVYPALPFFPILLILSFTLFGYNLVGIALPVVVATAVFPLAMYVACRLITGSGRAAYVATVLLYLFPAYQIHVLGAPEPDTTFVVLLLFGAALAAKANAGPCRRHWIGMGLLFGLASLTRYEGTAYAVVVLLAFLARHGRSKLYWLAVGSYLAALAPFALFYHSQVGSLWPSAFGLRVVSWRNLEMNLSLLSWTFVPWHAAAIGIPREALVPLLVAAALGAGMGAVAIARRKPALAGIPLAGLGHLVGGLFLDPRLVYAASPVEALRHLAYGIPFAAIGLAYIALVGFRRLSRLSVGWRPVLLAAVLLLASGLVYYEVERLARPEWQFGGRVRLLWTGSFYLLTDLWQNPVPLPVRGDPRPYEVLRAELMEPLKDLNLNRVNRSEPYHWASLLLALFGLAYSMAPAMDRELARSTKHWPVRRGILWRLTGEQL